MLWKFLETAAPKEKDWHNNQYWMSELPKTTKGKLKCAQQFQQDAIKMKPPQDWDMSVLAFAIQNHPNLLKDVQKDDVTKMKDKRNVQCHKNPATYEKEEFDKLFIDLDGSYKNLLGEPEARCVSKKLKKIKESKFSSRKALKLYKLVLCRTNLVSCE